ncbi:uncharacterized protein B0H18DRAFT_906836 [Fomitopsis serialis]|uniref:uncharacterized protein n=1 Tax=Fomitopsis serialis TaxID=139415 RepID=UPI00200721B1|nr:uncharacterized protein B0H18DRAFT_906836 [Neoantrodia serialis]KAH9928255.1 hypothetical protein B0H18DRAFT_906836 [Neoantrodia serialis]
MNSLWTLLDWILPSVRLSDDLEDRYLTDDGYSVASTLTAPRIRGQYSHELRRDWTRERDRDRERELDRERARIAIEDREKERQRAQLLERENAALQQRVAALERDLQSARQSLATFSVLSSPLPPANTLSATPRMYRTPSPNPVDLRTSYDSLLSSYKTAHRALQERTEEVASLKTFLSKTDEWSGAQLLQALRDLNAEIVQLAASVAEEFASALDRRVDLVRQSDRELLNSAIGPAMTNLLVTRDHSGDPTLVQFAIQAWEVFCVGRIMNAFCFGLPADVDQFLGGLFEQMNRTEPQATASRWRALTYNHSRRHLPLRPDAPSGSPPATFLQLNDTNLRGLLAVLALSGCTDSRGVHRDPLRSRFGAGLARICERAEHIAGAVREGVMSSVFEVSWVNAGNVGRRDERWFDWATMENVYAGHGSERSKVLCTVEFGLACVRHGSWPDGDGAASKTSGTTSGSVNGNGVAANGGAEGLLARSVLLKPKVLLESVMDIL